MWLWGGDVIGQIVLDVPVKIGSSFGATQQDLPMKHTVCFKIFGAVGVFFSLNQELISTALASSPGIHAAQTPELTDELIDTVWQEVEPAFIDVANIQREGDRVIFDTVDYEAGYTRLEGDCSTNQVRTLRDGYFLSMTTVSYRDFSESHTHEFADPSPLQQQLLDIACTVAPQKPSIESDAGHGV